MDASATIRILTTDRGDAGLRIDRVLQRHLSDLKAASRTRVQRWIDDGRVTINGRVIRRPAARAAAGDVVAITLPAATSRPPMAAEHATLDVLSEDDHLLVVNKPPGIVVHPTHRHLTGTMMNALLWHAREWAPPERPSIVGRLDKFTSGILVVAKTARVHADVQRAWGADGTRKEYLALVYGGVTPRAGEIRLALRRDPGDRRRVLASPSLGAPSATAFARLARTAAPRAGLSLLRCRLITGRTHQIRVHLAASGWPIVGDAVYGGPHWTTIADIPLRENLQAFPRQALHAWRIALTHPATGRTLRVEAPLPVDMSELLCAAGLDPSHVLAGAPRADSWGRTSKL